MTKILRNLFYIMLIVFSSFADKAESSKFTHKFVDLGLQESDKSEALVVNDNGQVVGCYWMFGKKFFFLWDEENGIKLIDLPESSNIVVLNNATQIAGNYKNDSGIYRGFVWDILNGFCDLGTLGGCFTHVYDMNDLGQIVGESESAILSLVDGRKESKAFLWEQGNIIDLGALTGDLGLPGDKSKATSINNLGQIIGMSNYPIAHKAKLLRSKDKGVFWKNQIIHEIDPCLDPLLHTALSAISINDHGLATYEDNILGFFVLDINTMNKMVIKIANNTSRFPEITNNYDIVLSPKQYLDPVECIKRKPDIGLFKKDCVNHNDWSGDSHEYVSFQELFCSLKNWRKNRFHVSDFNNKRWFVGASFNVYGETHAALLIPLYE